MSGEMMNFPDTAEEFMEQYKIVDSEEVYTNGAELVPIFRMEQWFKQHPEPHWIPVTERLPAMGKSVLMCDIDGDIYLGHRTQCGYYYPDFCGDRVKNVTAWCNLPEPYKGATTWAKQ